MKKKVIFLSIGIIIIFLILLAVLIINKNKSASISYNQLPSGDIILKQTTYNYPYKTTMVLYKDGKVMQSKIVDELTVNGPPDEDFKKIRTLNKQEIEKIIEQVNKMKLNKLTENSNNNYGISINIDGDMISAGYYNQSEIDELNNLLKELIY